MKIGLNATCLNDRPSGARQRFVGIYGELVRRLPDVEFVVYEPADCRVATWFKGAPNVFARRTPLPSEGRTRKFFNGLGYWRSALQNERFDFFEMFNFPLVKAPTGSNLLTIHDLRSLHDRRVPFRHAAYKSFIGKQVRSAEHVITVSETVKQEILDFFPGVPISVIYNGLDTREFDHVCETDIRMFRTKYRLPENFALTVGHFEKRKNYLRLVDAFAQLRDRGCMCPLVIIGNNTGERKRVEERIETVKLHNSVITLSDLSDSEVRCAYKLCSLFVFPSSYEGFGIPILEAMAAHRPIVLSDLSVFREITEEKGIYFPHDNVEAMAFAIEKVLFSSSETARLVEYGKGRVEAFSFKSLAAQLEILYNSLS